jgi:glycine oxidase
MWAERAAEAADRLNLIRVMPAQGVDLTAQRRPAEVAVVGGGVIGLAVAWEACRRGLRPLVLERARAGSGTTGVAAGMLAPVSEAAFGQRDLLALNLASAGLYPAWVAALRDASGVDPGYLRCGSLLVARDRDQAEALERERAFREEQGLAVERLLPSAARRLEPALAPAVRLAVRCPDDHAVDPRALVGALAAAVRAAGGEVREGSPVAAVEAPGGEVAGVRLAGGERIPAGRVVVAAGAWSAQIEGVAPAERPPLRPVKGQLLILRDPSGPGLLTSVVRSEDAYLVPRGDGRYVLGATVEERGYDTAVTAGAVHELLREAVDLAPGVAELEVEEALAGLRPTAPDNAPVIGPGGPDGLHWATGHHRHGVLLAPVTAACAVAGLLGDAMPDVAAPFGPQRFRERVPA